MKTPSSTAKRRPVAPPPAWMLRLYVAGTTAKSIAAFNNLNRICDRYLAGQYRIEIVDLLQNPALARGDQIVAVPTLVRQIPPPLRRIIGDLSNEERVLVGLDLRPKEHSCAGIEGAPHHG